MGLRQSETRTTWVSSSAQPVTPMAPYRFEAPLAGVSTTPKGAVAAPAVFTVSGTVMVFGEPAAPVEVTVTVAVCDPTPGRFACTRDSVIGWLPVPDVGLTVSHGWFEDAVKPAVAAVAPVKVT